LQLCRPDVVVLGVEIPGRDGLALTRAMRADPLLTQTRVILQLGSEGPAMLAQGHLAGVDRYLPHRCSPWQILATLEACLRAGKDREKTPRGGWGRMGGDAEGAPNSSPPRIVTLSSDTLCRA
jgi:DNA-binding response OmpR family regulator